jgi:HAD superfamily phosphatase (TIGR01668 family)
LKQLGFQVMIVSNNTRMRVSRFADPLDIPFIHAAKKPLTIAFKKALRLLGTAREETVVIGDQLLTDVLGGNRMGLFTILVVPISRQDGFFTRINRRIERLVFRWMERNGYMPAIRREKLKHT